MNDEGVGVQTGQMGVGRSNAVVEQSVDHRSVAAFRGQRLQSVLRLTRLRVAAESRHRDQNRQSLQRWPRGAKSSAGLNMKASLPGPPIVTVPDAGGSTTNVPPFPSLERVNVEFS